MAWLSEIEYTCGLTFRNRIHMWLDFQPLYFILKSVPISQYGPVLQNVFLSGKTFSVIIIPCNCNLLLLVFTRLRKYKTLSCAKTTYFASAINSQDHHTFYQPKSRSPHFINKPLPILHSSSILSCWLKFNLLEILNKYNI